MERDEKRKVLEEIGFVRLPEDEALGYFLHMEAGISISDEELASILTETELHQRLKFSFGNVLKEFQGGVMMQILKLNKMLKDRIQIVKP